MVYQAGAINSGYQTVNGLPKRAESASLHNEDGIVLVCQVCAVGLAHCADRAIEEARGESGWRARGIL